jgi:hypothetical protein
VHKVIAHLVEPRSDLSEIKRFRSFADHFAAWVEAAHTVIPIALTRWSPPALQCDTIVSHLDLNWARLPLLVALRSAHPDAMLIHVERPVGLEASRSDHSPGVVRTSLLRSCLALFDQVQVCEPERMDTLLRAELVEESSVSLLSPGGKTSAEWPDKTASA